MVTTGIIYLLIDTFPAIVIESTFSLLPLGRYLLPWATQNRNPPRCGNKHFFFLLHLAISIARHMASLVMSHFWTLSRSIGFSEFRDSHLWKTQICSLNSMPSRPPASLGLNLINHWSMNWCQCKDPVSHMCLTGTGL